MRGCSGTDEYEAGKEKITVYSLQKTRLHHCSAPFGQVIMLGHKEFNCLSIVCLSHCEESGRVQKHMGWT